jgi:hypothetical protein
VDIPWWAVEKAMAELGVIVTHNRLGTPESYRLP